MKRYRYEAHVIKSGIYGMHDLHVRITRTRWLRQFVALEVWQRIPAQSDHEEAFHPQWSHHIIKA